MTRPIRIGVLPHCGNARDFATWRSAVMRAEELGADFIFGYDHFHKPEVADLNQGVPVLADVQPDVSHFEGWTALASWGEITHRAEIGLLVTGIGYRNPDLLADMARTVDHISGGRASLGVGAGWYEKDYTTYGFEYGTAKSRADLFDEGLLRIERRSELLQPAPLRKIPILIGGSGPKRTLPAVARHADIWHTFLPIDSYREASVRVAELAAGFGRADSDIERSTLWTDPQSADAYLAAGATLFHTEVRASEGKYDLSTLEKMVDWRDPKR